MDLGGKNLYVGRAQKKAERQQELKKKFEMMKLERLNRYDNIFSLLIGIFVSCHYSSKSYVSAFYLYYIFC